jgi:hypothetical protein
MAAELGHTNDPKALVPGNVGAIVDMMWAMRSYGDSLHDAGAGLQRIDTTDGWSGEAADRFREAFHGEPRKWLEAGDCFHSAANALDSYASTLQWAQRQAGDAIQEWNEGEAATAQAKAEHARAVQEAQQEADTKTANGVPTTPRYIPFVDPGEAKREAARDTLNRARSQLRSAAKTAADTVGKARDKAPEKPGFWSQLGSGIGGFFEGLGHGLEVVGAEVVNGLASFGNAMVHHPGDVAAMVGGIGLTIVSGAGEGLGVALDATGVGAVAGVPLNAISAAGIVTGVGIAAAGAGDLAHHAATDDRVSPMKVDSASSGEGSAGRSISKTDRLKEHLTQKDLEGAMRESKGEVVARKPDGTPYNHIQEVRDAQNGLRNRIDQLKRQLGDTRISDSQRAAAQSELSEASRLLDHSEKYLTRK